MWTTLKHALKNNDKVFVLHTLIKNFKSPDLSKLFRSYYQLDYPGCVYLLEHPGTRMPETIVYDISYGEYSKTTMGFCAVMHHLMQYLKCADAFHLLPRVVWGKGCRYYEPKLGTVTNNAFEYYFEPISEAAKYPCTDFKNLIKTSDKHAEILQNRMAEPYLYDENHIRFLAESYKQHIRLNAKTKKRIFGDIKNIFTNNERVLGVHARGTDFNLGLKGHPHIVPPGKYLIQAQHEFVSGDYDKIFLATDDVNILKIFAECFGSKLVYYSDVPRVSGNKGMQTIELNRDMHHYKLGLEILRDVYTLVSCDSFICGLSSVSLMVRYVKEAQGEKFEKAEVLNEGIKPWA